MEFLFEFVAEILFQLLVQLIMVIGLGSMVEALKRPGHPVLSVIGFALWGLLAGGLSLWVWPHLFIKHSALRMLNLVVTPVVLVAAVRFTADLRQRRDPDAPEPDPHSFAFAFALAMGLVRYFFAK